MFDIMSKEAIECGMDNIKRYMMFKWGCDAADREFYPLEWYVGTGRASTQFLEKLFDAKAFMIGRILHKGGSVDETIQRIKNYIGYE